MSAVFFIYFFPYRGFFLKIGISHQHFNNTKKSLVSKEKRLEILEAAESLGDLAALSSNRLEALIGDRQGQHSIAINRQWRICFLWHGDGAESVEIVDYH